MVAAIPATTRKVSLSMDSTAGLALVAGKSYKKGSSEAAHRPGVEPANLEQPILDQEHSSLLPIRNFPCLAPRKWGIAKAGRPPCAALSLVTVNFTDRGRDRRESVWKTMKTHRSARLPTKIFRVWPRPTPVFFRQVVAFTDLSQMPSAHPLQSGGESKCRGATSVCRRLHAKYASKRRTGARRPLKT